MVVPTLQRCAALKIVVANRSVKREIRHFHVEVVQWWLKNVEKNNKGDVTRDDSNKKLCTCMVRSCCTRRLATTIFSATQHCNIFVTLFRMVTTLGPFIRGKIRRVLHRTRLK